MNPFRISILLGFALALAACGGAPKKQSLDSLDKELAGANSADPAVTAALQDQIMVDPSLSDKANRDTARAPETPTRSMVPTEKGGPPAPSPKGMMRAPEPTASKDANAPKPLTLGELASRQAQRGGTAGCRTDQLRYSATYAARLPAEFPVFPQAHVSEAAAQDTPGCHLRVVSFTTAAPLRTVLDYYYTRAKTAGYSAEHQVSDADHILAGTKGDDAFYVTLTEHPGGGTEADLIVNNGR